ncbi:hypothetical protein ACLOJK_003047 [Asimina triloba]
MERLKPFSCGVLFSCFLLPLLLYNLLPGAEIPKFMDAEIPKMAIGKSCRRQTDFYLDLAARLLATHKSNVVFSPVSMHIALSMVAAGAKGHTLDQMLCFLRSERMDDLNALCFHQLVGLLLPYGEQLGGPRRAFATGLWVRKGQGLQLRTSFKDTLQQDYRAEAQMVDFQSEAPDEVANEINSWAENKTSGLIKQLLPPGSVDNSTMLVLANALYFKGAWDDNFPASMTNDLDFHILDGSIVKVPFMTSRSLQSANQRSQGSSVLDPKDWFHPSQLKQICPRWLIHKVGRDLVVSSIHRKSFIEVNEEGTKAAAATAVLAGRRSRPLEIDQPIDFVADHPFAFLIRENMTGTVLFIGHVLNPLLWLRRLATTLTKLQEPYSVGFQAKLQMQSAQVANEINSWAENKTSGLIKELLPAGSVNSFTRLVLANALYFKGTWSEKFDASMTKDFDFHLLNGSTVKAPFMTCKKKQFISSCDGFKVLKPPQPATRR